MDSFLFKQQARNYTSKNGKIYINCKFICFMISHIKGLKINIFGKITFFTHLPLSRIAFVWKKIYDAKCSKSGNSSSSMLNLRFRQLFLGCISILLL